MQGTPFSRLTTVPTGPALGALLAPLEARTATDLELHDLLAAQARQLGYQQAQVWATIAEMTQRDPMLSRPGKQWTPAEVFESAVDEVRAELRLTLRAATREVEHAATVMGLPPVAAALSQGRIDRARAIALADGCLGLTEEQVVVLLDKVLPGAGEVTVTGLADRIRKVALALDPAWAEQRYQQSLRERRLVSYLNDDGTATISGQCLPADEVAAACARVDALAKAAKRAGADARIDYVRTEVFLGLLDGRFQGQSESDIVTELVRQFPKLAKPASSLPRTAPAAEAEAEAEVQSVTGAAAETAEAAPAGPAVAALRGVHVRVGLASLMGSTEEPGEIAGWGPVPASVARSIAARQGKAEWRFAVVDDDGQVLFDGITRRRPSRTGGEATRQAQGGIVELHVPLTLLSETTIREQHADWSALLTDLATQHAEQQPIDQDPAARFAGRPLRRRTQIHFQRCVFTGCRRPASQCELDHHHEYARGGRTDEQNLKPLCDHDHDLKTSRGWRLVQRDENTFVWISPLGRRHVVRREPIAAPLPAPIPRELPPECWVPDDDPDPPPTFTPRTRRGRPLNPEPPAATAASRAIDPALDPPPF